MSHSGSHKALRQQQLVWRALDALHTIPNVKALTSFLHGRLWVRNQLFIRANNITDRNWHGGEIAQLVRTRGRWPWGTRVRILVIAITVNYAAIYFPAVYNLQHLQRSVPLIPCLYGVRRLKILWVSKCVHSGFPLLISYILSLPWYNWNTFAVA